MEVIISTSGKMLRLNDKIEAEIQLQSLQSGGSEPRFKSWIAGKHVYLLDMKNDVTRTYT